jgi:hypothetical protein
MKVFEFGFAALFSACLAACAKDKAHDDDVPVRRADHASAAAAALSGGGPGGAASPTTTGSGVTPASAARVVCKTFTVQSAKDARGAPLWSSSGDLVGGSNRRAAPAHVPAGQAVKAACASRLGAAGVAVCVKSQAGEVGWMHHERLLGAGNPGSSLASIEGLPACADEVCNAGGCE